MVVMATEAMAQLTYALHKVEERPMPKLPCFRVRNATFSRALLLHEKETRTITVTLNARAGSKDSWYEFRVHSVVNDSRLEHCRGMVSIEEDRQKGQRPKYEYGVIDMTDLVAVAPRDTLKPLLDSLPGALWYQVSS